MLKGNCLILRFPLQSSAWKIYKTIFFSFLICTWRFSSSNLKFDVASGKLSVLGLSYTCICTLNLYLYLCCRCTWVGIGCLFCNLEFDVRLRWVTSRCYLSLAALSPWHLQLQIQIQGSKYQKINKKRQRLSSWLMIYWEILKKFDLETRVCRQQTDKTWSGSPTDNDKRETGQIMPS